MTPAKGIKQIEKLIDRLRKEKADQEKLFLLTNIKVYVELMREPVKKRLNKKKSAYAAKTRIIKKALKQFLMALDKISAKHEELGDSDVRDQMYKAIYRGFIEPQRGYSLPKTFGMFSDEGNDLVGAALKVLLSHPEVLVASKALKTTKDRFAAFQDDDVTTAQGTIMFEYFGYSNKPIRP